MRIIFKVLYFILLFLNGIVFTSVFLQHSELNNIFNFAKKKKITGKSGHPISKVILYLGIYSNYIKR
jgi:hypothetical protein